MEREGWGGREGGELNKMFRGGFTDSVDSTTRNSNLLNYCQVNYYLSDPSEMT